jgi:hypothetical protein
MTPEQERAMWEHRCPVEKSDMLIGCGEECNWCGRKEWDEKAMDRQDRGLAPNDHC